MNMKPYGLKYYPDDINLKIEKDFPFLKFPGRQQDQKDCVTITMKYPSDVYRQLKELSMLERRVMDQQVFWLIKQATRRLYARHSLQSHQP